MERHILIDTLRQHPFELKNFSAEAQDDQELVSIAVKKNGLVLQYASERLRNDYETVMTAVKSNGLSLEFASDTLKSNREIFTEAVSSNGNALEFVPASLRDDRDLILKASRNCDVTLVPKQFLSDEEIAQNLIDHDYRAFAYLSDELKKDIDLLLEIVAHDGDMLMYVPEEILNNKENVLELVNVNAYVLRYIPEELKGDKEIALAAMCSKNSPWGYSILPKNLQNDTDILRALVDNIKPCSDEEYDFITLFDSHNIPNALLSDNDFVFRLAQLYECSDFELELDKKLVLRMIELHVFNAYLFPAELLYDPEIQSALDQSISEDICDDEEDDL